MRSGQSSPSLSDQKKEKCAVSSVLFYESLQYQTHIDALLTITRRK